MTTEQSTTPRTDAVTFNSVYRCGVLWQDFSGDSLVESSFARELEADLSRTRAALEGCVKALNAMLREHREQLAILTAERAEHAEKDNVALRKEVSVLVMMEDRIVRQLSAALAAAEKEGA